MTGLCPLPWDEREGQTEEKMNLFDWSEPSHDKKAGAEEALLIVGSWKFMCLKKEVMNIIKGKNVLVYFSSRPGCYFGFVFKDK